MEYITQAKYKELEAEHLYLTTIARKEVIENLSAARALGDFKENSEYHDAREAQAILEDKIAHIEHILKYSKIIKGETADMVIVGTTVVLQKAGSKNETTYSIVSREEANVKEGKISNVSPFGQAIMGKKPGESFRFQTTNGEVEYKILKIL